MADFSSAFDELRQRAGEIQDLRAAAALLYWDQALCMPAKGADARARQSATLQKIAHQKLTDPALGRLLEGLRPGEEGRPYASFEASLVRVMRREFERTSRVSPELVMKIVVHQAIGYQAWSDASQKGDFEAMLPFVESGLELCREVAACFPGHDHPADPMIDFSDGGMTVASLRALFGELRGRLVPLAKAVLARPAPDDSFLRRCFPPAKQFDFMTPVIARLGFDFERGRRDTKFHDVLTAASINDVRFATPTDENDLRWGLFKPLHYAGHAMYEQGNAAELEGTPLQGGASSGMHESQSLLWENHVGRSRGFWSVCYPELVAAFPEQLAGVTLDDFYRAINKVTPSLNRQTADELTVALHIMIRFDLELDMLEGRLAARDLPGAWADRFRDDLGVAPSDHREGVLQDVHWFTGTTVGKFQEYVLAPLVNAQLLEAAVERRPELGAEMARGEYAALRDWLRTEVYRHGKKFTFVELVERVTGRPLGVDAHMRYLTRKYGELYGL